MLKGKIPTLCNKNLRQKKRSKAHGTCLPGIACFGQHECCTNPRQLPQCKCCAPQPVKIKFIWILMSASTKPRHRHWHRRRTGKRNRHPSPAFEQLLICSMIAQDHLENGQIQKVPGLLLQSWCSRCWCKRESPIMIFKRCAAVHSTTRKMVPKMYNLVYL